MRPLPRYTLAAMAAFVTFELWVPLVAFVLASTCRSDSSYRCPGSGLPVGSGGASRGRAGAF